MPGRGRGSSPMKPDNPQQGAARCGHGSTANRRGASAPHKRQDVCWRHSAPSGQIVPTLPAGFPAAVPAGIVRRFRDLVKRIKATKNYTETIGQTLGITVGA